MKYVVTLNDKTYEVEVEKGTATVVKADKAAAPAPAVETNNGGAEVKPANGAAPAAPAGEGERIAAPMPGTILGIKKKTGDAVKKGDVLFVLEAMKMENEIFAPKDGTMGQIFVSVGAAVNMGDLLAVLN